MSVYVIVRLVPLRDVEQNILEPAVRRVLVLVRLVLVFSKNLEEAHQQQPAWIPLF